MANRRTPNTTLPIIKRVAQTIDRYAMFAPNDKVLVGVSGGPDSVALLQILQTLASRYRLELGVAHLDHGLRPEAAEKEAAHATRLARSLKLACHVDRIELDKTAGSLEERARRARYAFFNRLAHLNGYTKIALGHHTDDNAEAVLLHLLRGSGIRGLAGIPPVRDGHIVRPLINLRRADILGYLQTRKITYTRDTSNDDLRFERNRIRQQLIPLLEKSYNPEIVATLHRTADLCWEEEQWLQIHVAAQVDDLVAGQSRSSLDLHVHQLKSAPLALQRRLIRDALRRWQGHLKRMGADHIDAIIRMLSPDWEAKRISLPHQWQVERTPQFLRFSQDRRQTFHRGSESLAFAHAVPTEDRLPLIIEIPEAGGRLHLSHARADHGGLADLGIHSEQFDLDQLKFPLTIRNFQPGDRLQPFCMHGSQKLKKLFGDRKIPKGQRKRIPLLISDEQIVWVAGVRRGRMAAISPATTRVLVARWWPAKQNH